LGLNINIMTKHDQYYNQIFFFHEDLDYIQMDNFILNLDYKFEPF